jgi:hypothetical protein
MSTRSNIGILNADGTVRACYIHWDGYPSGVGAELVKDFNSVEAINARLDKGDGSSLCDGFYKDSGEDEVDAVVFASKIEYLTERVHGWVEWQYLFEDGAWKVYKVGKESDPSVFVGTVEEAIKAE